MAWGVCRKPTKHTEKSSQRPHIAAAAATNHPFIASPPLDRGFLPSKVRAQVDELPAGPDRPDAQLEIGLIKVLGLVLVENGVAPGAGSFLGAAFCLQSDPRPSVDGRGGGLLLQGKERGQ